MKDGEVKEYFIELWQKNKKGPLRDVAVGYIHRAYESHLNFVDIHLDKDNKIRKPVKEDDGFAEFFDDPDSDAGR